jgi:hypothetical protein
MEAIDTIISTLLKEDREPIKKLKQELLSKTDFGLEAKLAVYSIVLEAIVDQLEDSGYLTREFIINTGQVGLEPIDL